MEDFLLVEYDVERLSRWLVEQVAPPRDSRRLSAMFERCVETPIARWRMHYGKGAGTIVRLEPGAGEVQIVPDGTASDPGRVEQLLFQRVAALYAQRAEHALQQQTARARFGTTT
jgi:hypothetical protein